MANKPISMTITAKDRFTKTFDALQRRINAVQAPVRKLQSHIQRADRTLGLARLRQGFLGITKSAWGVAKAAGAIIPPLGIITGAASIAGLYRLASGWAQLGQKIGITAHSMGMSPKKLQLMQNAAEMAGGSAEGMTNALSGLADTRWRAAHGFAPEAVAQFKALGLSFDEMKSLSPDKMFERIAARLRQIKDPVAQLIAAQKVFGSGAAGILPILQQTGKAYEDNIKKAERYGVLNDKGIAAANRLAQAQKDLKLAAEGFGNTLAETVEPVLRPIIQSMAEWIATNRQWIATRITDYIQRLVKWLSDGGWNKIVGILKSIGDGMSRVKDFLGGWKGTAKAAGIAIGLLFAAPVLTGLAGLIASLGTVLGIMKAISRIGKGDSGSIVEGARGAAGKEVARKTGMSLPGAANDNPAAGAVKKGLLRRGLSLAGRTIGAAGELYGLWQIAKEGWSGSYQKSQYGDMIARVQNDLEKAQSPERRAKLQSMLTSLKAGQEQSGTRRLLGSLFGNRNQPRGIRNNNPGNLNFAGQAGASLEAGGRFAAFNSPEAGLLALKNQLGLYNTRDHLDTVSGIISKWAPASENNTQAYIASVAKRLGVGADQHLGRLTPQMTAALMHAITRVENGKDPYGAMTDRIAGIGPDQGTVPSTNGSPMRLDVNVNHTNAPQGASVAVNNASPGVRVAGVRQQRAMAPASAAVGA